MFTSNLPKVCFLLDTSGSMNPYIPQIKTKLAPVVEAFRTKQIPADFYWSTFSNRFYAGTPNRYELDVPSNGGTNLFGSAVDLLCTLRQDLRASDKVLIILITDGEDTDHLASASTVAQEVSIAEDMLGWDFLFLGTNMNANKVGDSMGIKPAKALSFVNSTDGFDRMLDSVTNIVSKWTAGNITHDSDFFTHEDKQAQADLISAIRI